MEADEETVAMRQGIAQRATDPSPRAEATTYLTTAEKRAFVATLGKRATPLPVLRDSDGAQCGYVSSAGVDADGNLRTVLALNAVGKETAVKADGLAPWTRVTCDAVPGLITTKSLEGIILTEAPDDEMCRLNPLAGL